MENISLKTISTDAVQRTFKNEMPDIEHFPPKEYLYDRTFNHWAQIEYFGYGISREIKKICFMLHPLLLKLENVREHFDKPVIITNGIRDSILWHMLKAADYSPSRTTDHSYGLSYNRFGVGAIDHFVPGVDIKEVYDYEKGTFGEDVGQLILYKKMRFIHMSNPRELVFSKEFIEKNFRPYERFIEWDK